MVLHFPKLMNKTEHKSMFSRHDNRFVRKLDIIYADTVGINIKIAPDVWVGIKLINRGSDKDLNGIVAGKL